MAGARAIIIGSLLGAAIGYKYKEEFQKWYLVSIAILTSVILPITATQTRKIEKIEKEIDFQRLARGLEPKYTSGIEHQ